MAHLSHFGSDARAANPSIGPRSVRVWDPIVRSFHWTTVAGCILLWYIVDDSSDTHLYIGYVIGAALFVRLIWGFIGTRHARFRDFVPSPRQFFNYLIDRVQNQERRHIGHNPLAAMMILALMAALAVVSISGWMFTLDAFFGEEWLFDLHGVASDAIFWLAIVHVVAALFESVHHRENLVWSMVTGRKRS
jgi:cytochrome b